MPELMPGARVGLGRGYALRAPFKGNAERLEPGAPNTRAREVMTETLDGALARNEMQGVATIDITDIRRIPSTGTETRDRSGNEVMIFDTPDFGPELGQVVISVDEDGAIRWNFPLLPDGEIEPPTVRGAGGTKQYLIPADSPPTPPATQAANRSLFGIIGKKLLKVIVYPITDIPIGKAASEIAEHWESRNRAYGLRDFTPANFTTPSGKPLDASDLNALSKNRALLFVHGTFSTAHGAFGEIPSELMGALHQRYEGRVFAFNHYSLAHDPVKNADWLVTELQRLALATRLTVDIICHSRGGLVARTLAHGCGTFAQDRVSVDRVVFVASPNNGTLLAHPDHVVKMIDRLTSATNLLPPSGASDLVDGLLIAVKIIGHGALKGLEGLQSMKPGGGFINTLNKSGKPGAPYFAVAANYDPSTPGLRGLVKAGLNNVLDRVFEDAANDLVVPELGVYDTNGSPAFPIDETRVLRIPATAARWHSKLFGDPEVAQSIGTWLS
jgi:hypothetical protein